MKYALLAALAGGLSWLLYRTVAVSRSKDRVSARWLFEHDRATTRNTFTSVSIQWPINKLVNEQSKFNRWRLRKSA